MFSSHVGCSKSAARIFFSLPGAEAPGFHSAKRDVISDEGTFIDLAKARTSDQPEVRNKRKELPSNLMAEALFISGPKLISFPVIAESAGSSFEISCWSPETSMYPELSRAFCGPIKTGA